MAGLSLANLQQNEVSAGFLGALWPGENAWELRVEFKRVAEFPKTELLRIEHVPVPDADDLLKPEALYEINGATVQITALIGRNVSWDRITLFNAEHVPGCLTVLVNGTIRSRGRRLAFVDAKDESGNALKLQGGPSEPGQVAGRSPDMLPYSFNLKADTQMRAFTLVLAVSQQHVAEFLAKPEQVRENVN